MFKVLKSFMTSSRDFFFTTDKRLGILIDIVTDFTVSVQVFENSICVKISKRYENMKKHTTNYTHSTHI